MIESQAQSAARIKEQAWQLGFDLVGITSATRSPRADYLRQWLDTGQHGNMRWLASRFEERVDPRVYLPGAQSVICVAMNYYCPSPGNPEDGRGKNSSAFSVQSSELINNPHPDPPSEYHGRKLPQGKIARYALGDDYHEILKNRLHNLADWMRRIWPGTQTRACVDTAPLMEKELAARAGIGWLGKNSCIINSKIGSWIFLGEIVTTLALPSDAPATDHCGTCRRCIDACPTQAITAPYQLDARKCISYLTIENREPISSPLAEQIGDWLYGCDICQEVCPHNQDIPLATQHQFASRFKGNTLDTNEVLQWTSETYQKTLRNTAIKRVKLPQLQRNAAIVKTNAER